MENSILSKIRFLPPELKEEVNDFIEFILARHKRAKRKSNQSLGLRTARFLPHLILMIRLTTLKTLCNGLAY